MMETIGPNLVPLGNTKPPLAIKGLTKHFGGTAALRDVNLTVHAGEIHALLGANGAGKSTLIKILSGVYMPDSGQITSGGLSVSDPKVARRLSFVHQDLGLIDAMSVGENMAMAYGYPRHLKLINWRAVNAVATAALEKLETSLRLDRLVGDLSQAEKSIVAIARALTGDIDILVLDEPTASLPHADVEHLFKVLERLRAHAVGVMYVTHRLDEVLRLADAATVLRDGAIIASYHSPLPSAERLVADICGKAPPSFSLVQRGQSSTATLEVSDLQTALSGPVSFELADGEVLGLAGLRGQGHDEIGRAIAGVHMPTGGAIRVAGREVHFRNAKDAISQGVGYNSSKRVEESLATTMCVRENLFLNPHNFNRRWYSLRTRRTENYEAAHILQRFDVRPRDPEQAITALSGGNQQKVVLARLVDRNYRVLVLEEPTTGVDVGAKTEIYRMLARNSVKGGACVIVSSDLDELVQTCDRVLAFSRGRVVAELSGLGLTVEALTHEISGAGLLSLSKPAERSK